MPATPGFLYKNALPHLIRPQPARHALGLRWPHPFRAARSVALDRTNRSAPLAHDCAHVLRSAHRHVSRRHPLGHRSSAPTSRADFSLHLGHHPQPDRMARPHHAGVCRAAVAGVSALHLLFDRSKELCDGGMECVAANAFEAHSSFSGKLFDWRRGDLIDVSHIGHSWVVGLEKNTSLLRTAAFVRQLSSSLLA
jgi:hypothetical protein